MALIISTDVDPVNVQALGNWFSFKPGQIKAMDDKLVKWLVTERRYMGFMPLPEEYNDDPASEAMVKVKTDAIAEGRRHIISYLMGIVRNLEVSLQRDLDIAGIKTSSLTFASDGEKLAYKRLAKFKDLEMDEQSKELAELNKLREKINGNTVSPNARKTS